MDDQSLLYAYARTRDQAAFAELVRRHLDLVYSAALRRMKGDHHRAQDVTQRVFHAAAQNARPLISHPALPAWLHRTTRNAAINLEREDHRRRLREDAVFRDTETLAATDPEPAADWAAVSPVLDAALDTLGETDRQADVLRYFANQPFADIAARLHTTEAAAQMRAARALEKLRLALAKRGITSTTAAIGLALGANAVTAAPASVAASTLATLGAASVGATATGAGFFTFMTASTKLTLGVTAAVFTAAGIGWSVYHAQENASAVTSAKPAHHSASPALSGSLDASARGNSTAKTIKPSATAPTLADALALTDAFKRKLALASLGHDTAVSDFKRALEIIAQLKDLADRSAFIEGMIAAVAKMTPAEAVASAAELSPGEDRRIGLAALATAWGVNLSDPGAIDYFKSDGLNEGTLGVLVAVQDPVKGIAWAEGLLDGRARRQALHDSVRQLARSDPEAAIAYANTSTDPDEKKFLLVGAVWGWGEKDGAAAFAWASSQSADAAIRADLVSAATLYWARKDPAAATKAALSQPADLQARAVRTIASAIYQKDAAGAADWLAKLPEGNAKNEAANLLDTLRRDGYRIYNADGSVTTERPPAQKSAK